MARRTTTAVAVAAIAWSLGGCGEKEESLGLPSPSAPSTSKLPALTDAPIGLQTLETGRYCGQERVGHKGRGGDEVVRQCVDDSVKQGLLVSFTQAQPLIEGGLLMTTRIYRPEGDVLVVEDTTEDAYGGGWGVTGCEDLTPPERDTECGEYLPVDDQTPVEVIQRDTRPACGFARLGSKDGNSSRAISCFITAADRGEERELRTYEKTEEGPVEDFYRSRRDGSVDLFTDATKGGTGPRTWYVTQCEDAEFALDVNRGCQPKEELPKPN